METEWSNDRDRKGQAEISGDHEGSGEGLSVGVKSGRNEFMGFLGEFG